jgi:alkanesulfonate monooxygenase SsuD/methylene tetrahydromethanopterin reductase-like flavin-dependent oxidoreductase (luciferase family)
MTAADTPLHLGLMLPSIPHTVDGRLDKERILDAARIAERAAFDGVYIGDHLLHPNPLLESLVTLSLVVAVTERVSIGTCVMLIALRDPLWLAKQLGTLDHFAPGRLRIGLGVGGAYPGEFNIVNVALPARGRRTEEVLRTVRAALTGALPMFDDAGVSVGMRPVPRAQIPFLFAGRAEAALRRAAALGDGWVGYLLSTEDFANKRAFLLQARAGRPEPFTCGMLLHVQPAATYEGAHERALEGWRRVTTQTRAFPHPEKLFIAGPTEAIVEHLRRFWNAGCTEMVLAPADQGAGYLEQARFLADEILPKVRAFSA